MPYPYPHDLREFKRQADQMRREKSPGWDTAFRLLRYLKRVHQERDAVAFAIFKCYISLPKYSSSEAHKGVRLLRRTFSACTVSQLRAPMGLDGEKVGDDYRRKDPREKYGLPSKNTVVIAIEETEAKFSLAYSDEYSRQRKKLIVHTYVSLSRQACSQRDKKLQGWEKRWKELEALLATVGLSLTGEKIEPSYE
jgi:hypothetical protein